LNFGLAYHEKYRQYDLGPSHPYRGDRFPNAMRFFERQGLLNLPNLTLLNPRPATRKDLLRVHTPEYIDSISRLAEKNIPYDADTPISPQIVEGAMWIIGGAIEAGKAIIHRDIDGAMALGCGFHHAGRDYGGGFCIFNDIAILIEYLREKHGLKRFLVLDYDVHFGNGTSDIYYADPNVLYISLHQDPKTIYPGTGFVHEIGRGEGEGYNINVPLPPKTSGETYLFALDKIFRPIAQEFRPDIILANGGSDAHFADGLGSLGLTYSDFHRISRTIVDVSNKVCKGRTVLMLTSGYNPKVLPACWYALAAGVFDIEKIDVKENDEPLTEPEWVRKKVEDTVKELKDLLKNRWKCYR